MAFFLFAKVTRWPGGPAYYHSTVIARRSHAVVASVSEEIADSLQLARCDCFDASWPEHGGFVMAKVMRAI